MTKYKETIVPEGDTESDILDTLAGGHPHLFIVCKIEQDGQLDLRLSVGGGVASAGTVRALLEQTLKALPA